MLIEAYLEGFQAAELGRSLQVGEVLQLDIAATIGSTLSPPMPLFDAYISDSGRKGLRKMGLAQYAFCGEIQQVKVEPRQRWDGLSYQETLIDCGIPLLFVTYGLAAAPPFDLDKPDNHEITPGRFLSGLGTFHVLMSAFREPPPQEQKVRAKLRSIKLIALQPDSQVIGELTPQVGGAEEQDRAIQPFVIEIDVFDKNNA